MRPNQTKNGSGPVQFRFFLVPGTGLQNSSSHGTFIIVVGNNDLEQKLNPNRLPCAKVLGSGHAVSVMSAARCLLNP
jgi:hypothetical protein